MMKNIIATILTVISFVFAFYLEEIEYMTTEKPP